MVKRKSGAQQLEPYQLRVQVDPKKFPFKTTEELAPFPGIFGQQRALDALDLGINIKARGYNVFLTGDPGTGKTSILMNLLREKAKQFPTPPDWCYCYNFDDPDQPLAFSFPTSQGTVFKKDMAEMIGDLTRTIPKVRESELYLQQRNALEHSFRQKESKLFYKLRRKAKKNNLDLDIVDGELTLHIIENGQVLEEEDLEALSDRQRSELEHRVIEFHDQIDEYFREQRKLEKRKEEQFSELERSHILKVCTDNLDHMRSEYGHIQGMPEYLERIKQEIPAGIIKHLARSEAKPEMEMLRLGSPMDSGEDHLLPFEVNLFVNNARTKGAPVILESNPGYYNLLGKIEYREHAGWLRTDFMNIKPGALHMANGGFLVLQANDLLRSAYAWDALKRALRTKEASIQEPNGDPRGRNLKTLNPMPIPLNVKVILVGSYQTWDWLWELDEDFPRLFKVNSDFETSMPFTAPNALKFARFIAKVGQEEERLPVTNDGVARLLEYSTRQAGHQARISVKLSEVIDLYMESDFWARQRRSAVISSEHIARAVQARSTRDSRIQELFERQIREGELLIQTRGKAVGQINAIAVYELGNYAFGLPSRITARAYAGRSGIINIDRESDLTGPIHNKATLILQGVIGGLFAHDNPLSLSVSITFEQTYGIIEGDSATCAEFFAVLSAISRVPIRQGIAITGSMNQQGGVQPIGGVNEKIEGVFRVCHAQGLTGEQGVIIPKQNVRHLALSDEVIKAVAEKKFNIWAIARIDEAVPLFMDIPAGTMRRGSWTPSNSLYASVDQCLRHFKSRLDADDE